MTRRGWVTIAAVLTLYIETAHAATVTWSGAGLNDNWNNAANWQFPPGTPPAPTDDAVVGGPAPTDLNVNATLSTLTVGRGGLINMLGGNSFTISNGLLTNSGEIVVNSDAVDLLSSITFNGSASIDGNGVITLNKPFFPGLPGFFPDRGATIESNGQVNHGASHTIEGFGRINATLFNEGTVRAFNPGAGIATLDFGPNQQFNENLFTSSPSGTLAITSSRVTQGAAGRIVADTANVTLNGTRIVGGTLESVAGGQVNVTGTGATLEDVQNDGVLNVNAQTFLEGPAITNNGTLNGNTTIWFNNSLTLQGSGMLAMNNNALHGISSPIVTQAAGHTIRGRGSLHMELVNNGLIEVSPPSGVPTPTLTLSSTNKTNNNLINVPVGTVLQIAPITVTQDPNNGRITAAGQVTLTGNSKLIGGRVETTGTGNILINGIATLADVTLDAATNLRQSSMRIEGGGITNNGLFTVNQLFANVVHTVNFDGQTAMTLDGSGEIVLNGPSSRAELTVATGKKLTQEFGHSITGFGLINGEFVNRGEVVGDSQFNPIVFTGTLAGTNRLENVRVTNIHSIGEGSIRGVPTFGTYELASTATAQFEIGGTHPNDYDRLLGQTIKLDGILSLEQIDIGSGVFQPQLGDTFEIVNGSSVMGTFDDIVTAGLDPGIKYNPIYTSTTLTLEAVRRYTADFDFDGDVDDDDLAEWEAGYGATGGATFMDGDADEDGDVDGLDFLTWQQQYGSGLGPIVAAIAVPEPTLSLLLSWTVAGLFIRVRAPFRPRSRNLR